MSRELTGFKTHGGYHPRYNGPSSPPTTDRRTKHKSILSEREARQAHLDLNAIFVARQGIYPLHALEKTVGEQKVRLVGTAKMPAWQRPHQRKVKVVTVTSPTSETGTYWTRTGSKGVYLCGFSGTRERGVHS